MELSKLSKVRITVDGVVLRLVTFANLSVGEFALLNMLMTFSASAWSFVESGWKAMNVDHLARVMLMIVLELEVYLII